MSQIAYPEYPRTPLVHFSVYYIFLSSLTLFQKASFFDESSHILAWQITSVMVEIRAIVQNVFTFSKLSSPRFRYDMGHSAVNEGRTSKLAELSQASLRQYAGWRMRKSFGTRSKYAEGHLLFFHSFMPSFPGTFH